MIIKLLKLLGAGLRNGLVAIGAVAFLGTIGAIADYALTQGSGTNFASKVISTVHYAAGVICDATVGESQCAAVDSSGNLKVSASVPTWAGGTLGSMANYGTSPGAVLVPGVNAFVTNTNPNGQAVMALSSPVVIASDQSAVTVTPQPTTSGGLTNYFFQPAASDNHQVVKAGAGQVYKISITNNSATVNYVRLYNATTGFNGCNSATNLIYANAIPANTAVGGIIDSWVQGLSFSTGISICVTSGYATNDTTNATASAMDVNIGYK